MRALALLGPLATLTIAAIAPLMMVPLMMAPLMMAPLMIAPLMVGCGGAQTLAGNTNGGGGGVAAAAAPSAACGPEELSVRGGCLSMEGTSWELTTHMPEGTRMFLVDFHPGGRCTSHDPADSTPDDDEWAVQDKGFRFWFNHRYVVYEASLDDPRTMHGITHNVTGLSWAWTATRVR